MPIKHDFQFNLGGVTSNFCMKYNGDKCTTAVIARIQARETGDRDGPPACGNGFKTDATAFAKGHIIALQLGGSDDPYNVVPQFEWWQGNGPWRKMETELEAYNGKLMLVEMTYNRPGDARTWEKMVEDFVDSRLMPWTDKRIPDGFTVSVRSDTLDPKTINTDTKFTTELERLKKLAVEYQRVFTLGNDMPSPDREGYVIQYGADIALERFEEHQKSKPGLERQVSSIPSFLSLEGEMDIIREEAKDKPGMTDTEAMGLQYTNLAQSLQKITKSKLKQKYKQNAKKKRKLSEAVMKELGLTTEQL